MGPVRGRAHGILRAVADAMAEAKGGASRLVLTFARRIRRPRIIMMMIMIAVCCRWSEISHLVGVVVVSDFGRFLAASTTCCWIPFSFQWLLLGGQWPGADQRPAALVATSIGARCAGQQGRLQAGRIWRLGRGHFRLGAVASKHLAMLTWRTARTTMTKIFLND